MTAILFLVAGIAFVVLCCFSLEQNKGLRACYCVALACYSFLMYAGSIKS